MRYVGSLNRVLLLACALVTSFGDETSDAQTLVDFDGVSASGGPVDATDLYLTNGLRLASIGGPAYIVDLGPMSVLDDPNQGAYSPPNVVLGADQLGAVDTLGTFYDPVTGAPATASHVSLWAMSGPGPDQLSAGTRLVAYDVMGNVIDEAYADSTLQFQLLSVSAPDIASFRFDATANFEGFDDLTFTLNPCCCGQSQATVVDFDDVALPQGDAFDASTFYQVHGLHLSSKSGPAFVRNFGGPSVFVNPFASTTSPPNLLIGSDLDGMNDVSGAFVDSLTGSPRRASFVGLWAVSGPGNDTLSPGLCLSAFDPSGVVIGQSFPPPGAQFAYLSVCAPNIATFTLSAGGLFDALDDLAFILEPSVDFVRGDANGDGASDIADPVYVLDLLFAAGSTSCENASDVNDDDAVDIADVIFSLSALFSGGPRVPPPNSCGQDPTPGLLWCQSFPDCP